MLGSGYCTVQLTSIILKKFGFIAFCCAGDLLAGFGGVSAVDSPQRSNAVSPGNPWDLSALDPMTGLQPLSAQVWGPGGQAEALELIALLTKSIVLSKFSFLSVFWIRIRIQEPSGSESVFGVRIRIHTCK